MADLALFLDFPPWDRRYFQTGPINSCGMSVFSHHLQPGDIILMAVIMLHGKFQCHLTENQNGRTVNAVMFQKLMITSLDLAGIYLPVKVPSGFMRSRPVEQITSPVIARAASCAASFPSSHQSSASRNATYLPFATDTPRLREPAAPRFRSFYINKIPVCFPME